MKYLAVITNSHRQSNRLRNFKTFGLSGICTQLGSRQRVWYVEDTEAARKLGLRVHKRLTETFNAEREALGQNPLR